MEVLDREAWKYIFEEFEAIYWSAWSDMIYIGSWGTTHVEMFLKLFPAFNAHVPYGQLIIVRIHINFGN